MSDPSGLRFNPLARHYVLSLGDEGRARWLTDREWHADVYLAAIIVRGLYLYLGDGSEP